MWPFMDFVQNAFYEESAWNRDNSYGNLTVTSRSIWLCVSSELRLSEGP